LKVVWLGTKTSLPVYTLEKNWCCELLKKLYDAGCISMQPSGMYVEVPTWFGYEWSYEKGTERAGPRYSRIGRIKVCPFCKQNVEVEVRT